MRSARPALRWVLAVLYAVAGYFHLVSPAPFLDIMPSWVPAPEQAVRWTGVAEIAGAMALAQPWQKTLRRWGGIGLALYAVCVFPANINHFALDMARAEAGISGSWGLAYHIPRMALQPVLVWLALWTSGVTNWPFARRPAL